MAVIPLLHSWPQLQVKLNPRTELFLNALREVQVPSVIPGILEKAAADAEAEDLASDQEWLDHIEGKGEKLKEHDQTDRTAPPQQLPSLPKDDDDAGSQQRRQEWAASAAVRYQDMFFKKDAPAPAAPAPASPAAADADADAAAVESKPEAAAEAEMTPLNNPTPTETMETAETKSQEKHQDEEPKDHATQAADVSEFSVAYSF